MSISRRTFAFTLALTLAWGAGAGRAAAQAAPAKPAAAKAAPAKPVKITEADLAPKYRDWLSLVAYHIQPVEREVFFKLTNDRDRDLFVETFWKQRDPTQGTPANEYKEELQKRFAHVNETFRRGTTRAGWKTDMGRIYMILGEPVSTESFEASLGLVPCIAWTFYGDVRKNLPTHFVLLFYKRSGIGEFKLYDPMVDGPFMLLQNKRDVEPTDYETLYEKLMDIAPSLADAAISVIPGEYGYNLTPSPRNSIILADILTSPKKDVNPAYATHFMEFKTMVSTEYMTNYVESSAEILLARDPATGLTFLHFSIVPAAVNVDFYVPKNQYYCDFRADVSLRDGDAVTFQYTRQFPIYFDESEAGRIRANGLAIEDSFPVVPGRHRLYLLLQNSVGKQFTVVEKEIVVPEPAPGPRIDALVLGYKAESYPRDVHVPFKLGDRKIVVDPKDTYASGDTIQAMISLAGLTDEVRAEGELRVEVRGLRERNPVRKSYRMFMRDPLPGGGQVLIQALPASELEPDYYELKAVLAGPGGASLSEATRPFVVSPEAAVGHPIVNAKGVPLSSRFLYYYMMAEQLDKLGRVDAARARYEEAYRMRPDFAKGAAGYGAFLVKTGAFEQAAEVARRLQADEKTRFEGLFISAGARMGREDWAAARDELIKANMMYNSDVRVLNALGACYAKLGDKAQAVAVLSASLKLLPDQPEIKARLAELQR